VETVAGGGQSSKGRRCRRRIRSCKGRRCRRIRSCKGRRCKEEDRELQREEMQGG
jgi:hypothetical protein